MKEKKKTIVVNIFSGPGSGKSMLAAQLFHRLKWNHISCEMTREYAKTLVWNECTHLLVDQMYVFAKQNHKLISLNGKVDVIITDAPLINSIYYDLDKNPIFEELVIDTTERYNNLNYFLMRNAEAYKEEGRYHDLDNAKEIDNDIENILYKHNQTYKKIKCEENVVDDIIDDIMFMLENTNGKAS